MKRSGERWGRALGLVIVVALLGCSDDGSSPVEPPGAGNLSGSDSSCLARASFGAPDTSEYVLPFEVGSAYLLSQSYCFANGGHRSQLAYDFDLPVGTAILAVRAGVVVALKEHEPDDGQGTHNYVYVEHADGTVAFYAHCRHEGVDVEVGEFVRQGQRIAASGNSGVTGGPHLHVGVYQSWPPRTHFDVPFNFRNAEGVHDERSGLVMGETYRALPFF